MIAVPLWLGMLFGQVALPTGVPALYWHAHEMLYGFACAVIVGFLLTAVRAWTGLETPRGKVLAALAALWLSARVTALTGPHLLHSVLDVMLLPAIALALLRLLLRAGNRRNFPLIGVLLLLASANVAFHLSAWGLLTVPPLTLLRAGLALIVVIECVIGGRVIPAFTSSAVPTVNITQHPALSRAAMLVTLMALAAWVAGPAGPLPALALAVAALLQLWLAATWHPWAARSRPILWILHVAYAWIPLGFGLLALAEVGVLNHSPGVHALAVGATGGLIIAMITRTARGHTGRPLRASRAEIVAYMLVLVAAGMRSLFAPFVDPGLALPMAGFAWSGAFLIYLAKFTPWLISDRLDGKDG